MSDIDRRLRKWDYIYYALWAGAAIGALMWFIGWLGHQLGWFNDLGDLLLAAGRWLSVGLGLVALVVGASRTQVATTRGIAERTQDAVHETRDAVHETRDAVHETRDAVHVNGAKLDEQTLVLREIRDRL